MSPPEWHLNAPPADPVEGVFSGPESRGKRMTPDTTTFLRTLYNGIGAGFVEVRGQTHPKPKEGGLAYREWFPLAEIERVYPSVQPHIGKLNLWFGVGLRKAKGVGKKEDVGCLPGIWLDIDFKSVPQEKAVKFLREFPIRASIGILSGGGLHVYYLTKEPIFAPQFPVAEATMKALAKAIGADTQACHADLCLRLPNTVNVKYLPPRPVRVVVGPHDDRRCNLEDFEKYLTIDVPDTKGSPGRREVPGRELPTELAQRVSETLTGIWLEGYRHGLSLLTAGVLAHSGFSEASAVRVVEAVCSLADDNEKEDRIASVRDTYAKFAAGKPVAGQPTLEQLIESFPPGVIRDKARKLYESFKKMIPRPPKRPPGEVTANFEVARIEKFTSTPARYRVTINYKLDENEQKEYTVTCETPTVISIHLFRTAFFEATPNLVLSPVTQSAWEKMLQQAPLEIKPAPEEASSAGAIRMELANFLEEKKPNPEYGELNTFCGYDERHIFFVLNTFKKHLAEKGQKPSDREVIHALKDAGWEPEKRRYGDKTVRLWVKPIDNGNMPGAPQQDMFGTIPHQRKES